MQQYYYFNMLIKVIFLTENVKFYIEIALFLLSVNHIKASSLE